jgi:tetratricopeptide (TPR) repeat protein
MKFAHFYCGRSHQFEADPTVTDYLIAGRAAQDLTRGRKYEDAITAYVTLAEGAGATDIQKSDALQHAATCARSLNDFDRANELADRIPIEAVAKTVRMENLLAQREIDQLIEQFGDEDFGQWPFWQIGAAAFARGRAYHAAKVGQKADADLQLALEFTSDSRTRISILRTIGFNHERVLEDDDAALEAYRDITGQTRNTGSAEYYYGVQGAARILTRRGKFDEALASLRLVDIDKLSGYWRGSMLLALGETMAAAGRNDEALAAYRNVLSDDTVTAQHRDAAENAIKAIIK